MPKTMNPYQECPICGQMCFPKGHTCAPKWWVRIAKGDWHYDSDAEPVLLRARTAEDAAEDFAEVWDAQDSELVIASEGTSILLAVRPHTHAGSCPQGDPEQEQLFKVDGAIVFSYIAREIKDD